MDKAEAKRRAAERALDYLPSSGVIGLGSGSTSHFFIHGVAKLVREGRVLRGVATSRESKRLALELGIELLDDEGPWTIDVCVDGADQVSRSLDLIKGGGGMHAREKIVNFCSRTNIIVVDESKLSEKLGIKAPVPVEVLPFGHRQTARTMMHLGEPTLRVDDGQPYITDSGNLIYDIAVGVLEDPAALERALKQLPGVVETGLFCGRADRVIVGGEAIFEWTRRRRSDGR